MELMSIYITLAALFIAVVVNIIVSMKPKKSDVEEYKIITDEFSKNRDESAKNFRSTREELSGSVHMLQDSMEKKLEGMRSAVEVKLQAIQSDNNAKLEKMRETVDEKLHSTLEKRLGDSFKLVSEKLEAVQKGLGEMQSLAAGVGDLKKVLTNIKTRGTLGEYQLENILEQILAPEQYSKNVRIKNDENLRVDFAINLPSRDAEGQNVLLPVDSKFPIEDYYALVDAYERNDPEAAQEIKKQLSRAIKNCAKSIKEKYIDPPATTDFAIMFLPCEGLFAEVLRDTGLFESVQKDYKVNITGPTTIAAFLNSLRMGFRSLAIEKRSSEIWELLGMVKTEFGRFGGILDKTKKKLSEASNVIDQASVRSRAIERRLRNVQKLPQAETDGSLENELKNEDEIENSIEKEESPA